MNKYAEISNYRFNISQISPSEFSNRRIMSQGESKFVGNFDIDRTPYMKEVVDFFSPYSPITTQALMKGHQLGGNAAFENGICYRISESPTNIMLVSANEGLAAKAMNRINRAIDGFDIRHLISANTSTKNTKSKASGDQASWKQFVGGSLISYGGNSYANMRSNPVQVAIADECDTYKIADDKGGNFTDVMEDRTSSYGPERKILYLSTPLLKNSSIIESAFLQGDQRYYNVPCPCCGEFIKIEWYGKTDDGMQYGILFDVKRNRVVSDSVRYRCPKCGNEFKELQHKTDMLQAGEWVPTAEPIHETFRSHHISSLYAPVGMKNWTDYARKYQEAYPRAGFAVHSKLQSFHNSVLGLTWEQKGKVPKANKLQNNQRVYKIGEVPHELSKEDGNGDIMFLTCACDLNGEMGVETGDDVRLDYEIVAWSNKGASYSIDAGSIGTFRNRSQRKKENPDRKKWTYRMMDEFSVWHVFAEILQKEYSGMKITITGVDIGHFTEYANDFIRLMQDNGLAVVGAKGDKPDSFRMTAEDKQLYKKSKEVENLYLFNVNKIKDNVAEYMELEATADYQPSNFMNFPNPSDGKYSYKDFFAHFQGEQKKLKKNANNIEYYLWEKISGRMNHMWDCRIYNDVLRIIVEDLVCREAELDNTWNNMCSIIDQVGNENINILMYAKIIGIKKI